ncbi:MAG: DUF2059 domain-containing protein [Nevskiaceae bacterium]|nr:MAG: DUF2059 domain-containing protein [Nevskiaceae bacterium]
MNKLIGLCLLAVAPLAVAAPAAAPQANIKAVEHLLEVSHASNAATTLQNQVQQQLAMQLQQSGPADRAVVEKYMKELSSTVLPELAWPKLKPDIVKAYATTFTDQEIADLTKFYESPTGQSYIRKAPELNRATMQAAQARLQALVPKVQDISHRMEAELAAKHKTEAAPKK